MAGGVTAPTAASEAPAVPAEAPAADAIAPSGVSDASAAAAIGQASAPAAATQALQAGGAPSQASTPAPAAQMLQAGAPSPRPARRSHPAAVIVLCLVGMLVGSLLVCLLVSCVSWGGAHVRHGVSYVSLDASLTDQSVAEGAWRSGDGQTVTFKGDRTFTWEYDRSGDSYVTGTYAIEDLGSEVPESLSDLLAGTGLDELLDAAAGVGIDPSLFGVGVYELRLTADGGASDGLDASLDVKGNTLDVLLVVSGDGPSSLTWGRWKPTAFRAPSWRLSAPSAPMLLTGLDLLNSHFSTSPKRGVSLAEAMKAWRVRRPFVVRDALPACSLHTVSGPRWKESPVRNDHSIPLGLLIFNIIDLSLHNIQELRSS